MFEYGNPDAILSEVLKHSLPQNDLGHTVLDDWQHFCSYSGCDPNNTWAKLAFVSARG